jgi:hypothetical protein
VDGADVIFWLLFLECRRLMEVNRSYLIEGVELEFEVERGKWKSIYGQLG